MSAHRDVHHHRTGLGMRLRAAWAREDLDRRLADGADPDTDPLLHTRAERLVTPGVLFTAASSAEVARAARAAVDNLRAHDVPVKRRTAGEGPVRTTPASLPTPTPGTAAAAEHQFYRPTVAPVPARPPVDAATW